MTPQGSLAHLNGLDQGWTNVPLQWPWDKILSQGRPSILEHVVRTHYTVKLELLVEQLG